uniref:Candidate secreted effector n=1 Tax=Meloidogyne incognita TaxID=6306 RepID=A0A914KKV0_MELIC
MKLTKTVTKNMASTDTYSNIFCSFFMKIFSFNIKIQQFGKMCKNCKSIAFQTLIISSKNLIQN